jgi:hypothetical protein
MKYTAGTGGLPEPTTTNRKKPNKIGPIVYPSLAAAEHDDAL